jgi:hypothetical protein
MGDVPFPCISSKPMKFSDVAELVVVEDISRFI